MSIVHCDHCDKNIDTDYDAEHFEDCSPELRITISGCARCGGTHKDLQFKEFTNPIGKYRYFTTCPTLKEPILMGIKVDTSKPITSCKVIEK